MELGEGGPFQNDLKKSAPVLMQAAGGREGNDREVDHDDDDNTALHDDHPTPAPPPPSVDSGPILVEDSPTVEDGAEEAQQQQQQQPVDVDLVQEFSVLVPSPSQTSADNGEHVADFSDDDDDDEGIKKLFAETNLRVTERHLPCGITQCYLPPDAVEHAPS